MLKVEVTTQAFDKVSGTSAKTGKDYSFIKQQAHIFLNGEKYPEKFEITHEREQDVLSPGIYVLDIEKAVTVDRFGGVALDGRKLVFRPVAAKAD